MKKILILAFTFVVLYSAFAIVFARGATACTLNPCERFSEDPTPEQIAKMEAEAERTNDRLRARIRAMHGNRQPIFTTDHEQPRIKFGKPILGSPLWESMQ